MSGYFSMSENSVLLHFTFIAFIVFIFRVPSPDPPLILIVWQILIKINYYWCINFVLLKSYLYIIHTSKTFSSISTVKGKSSLIATVALNALDDSLHLGVLPKTGCWPAGLCMYSSQVHPRLGGGHNDSFLWISAPKNRKQISFTKILALVSFFCKKVQYFFYFTSFFSIYGKCR